MKEEIKIYTPVGKFLQDHYDEERKKREEWRDKNKLVGLDGKDIAWPEQPKGDFSIPEGMNLSNIPKIIVIKKIDE